MKSALLILALAACSRTTPSSEPIAPAQPAPVVLPTSTEPSIYELGITLRAGDREIGLDAHRGNLVLLTMFYGSCSVACPALIEDVRRTLAEMPSGTQALLVSFDPVRDSADKLAALARARGLDDRFTLAAALDDADARALAATIGFKYRKLDNGEFFHSSTIVLLDAEGRALARSEGFNQRGPLISAAR